MNVMLLHIFVFYLDSYFIKPHLPILSRCHSDILISTKEKKALYCFKGLNSWRVKDQKPFIP